MSNSNRSDSQHEFLALSVLKLDRRRKQHRDDDRDSDDHPGITPSALGCVVIVVAGHMVATLMVALGVEHAYLPPAWRYHLYLLLLISLTLGWIVAVNARGFSGRLAFSLQIVVYAVFSYGSSIWLRTVLLTMLLCEAPFCFRGRRAAALVSFGLILSLLFPRNPIRAWETVLMPTAPAERIAALTVLFALGAALYAATWFKDHWLQERNGAEQLQRSVMQLTSANVGFQDYALHVRDRTAEEERRRIARELHDSIGYTLTNLTMMMEASQDLLQKNQNRLAVLLRSARNHAQEGITEMRRTLRELRAIETQPSSCVSMINRLARGFETATGVRVEVQYRNLPWILPPETSNTICRMVQEGLTNAFRHGKATSVVVTFWYGEEGIRVTIQDNGTGSDEIKEGIGLQGMRERIEPLGGWVRVQSVSNGTEVSALLPVRS